MAKGPLIGGFNVLTDRQSANQRTVNLMAERSNGKTEWRFRTTPGLRLKWALPTFPIRGAWEANERVFVVAGDTLYEIFDTGGFTALAVITYKSTPVSMDDNGVQLVLVDGESGWVYDLTDGTVTKIVNEAFYPSPVVAVVDGYGVFVRSNTQQFFLSGLYDLLSYDALDFASAEVNPDKLVWLVSTNTGILMLGTKSLELYWNTGDANQVFQRRSGSQLRYGCVAPYSVVQVDNGVIWVGRDENGQGSVYRLSGAIPTKISTTAVEELLSNIGEAVAGATAFAYQQVGHAFYILNVPGSDTTLVYDLSTGIWHERQSFKDNGKLGRWQADMHVLAFGKNVVGDYATGNLYIVDLNYYFDNDRIIRRERDMTPVYDDNNLGYATFASFSLDLEVGVGLENGPWQEPYITLQCSDDGGKSFGFERQKPIGRIGKTEQTVSWRRLGTSTNRVFRIAYGFPTQFAINDAYVDASR